MEPIQYVRALRQWWWVVVAAGVIGLLVVTVVNSSRTTEYEATHDLIYAPNQTGAQGDNGGTSVARMAFLTTRGDVLKRAAQALHDSPSDLVSRVSATANPGLDTLSITATGKDPKDTERLADTFAAQLKASLDDQAKAARQTQVDQLQNELAQVRAQIAALGSPGDDATGAQLAALTGQLSETSASLRDLTAETAPNSGLSTVEAAIATTTSSGQAGGLTRLLIGGFVGLLIGAGLALLLTRFDTRIRTKEEAEEAFGLPVIAEIPLLSRAHRQRHEVISITDPESPGAEAYRSLRTSLVFAPRVRWALSDSPDRPRRRRGTDRAGEELPSARSSETMLVVSPGSGEGKSTSVANLAVAFAESGKYVLVLSGDLRRPMVDGYLGVEPGPGMSELLAGEEGVGLVDVVRATSVPDVRMIPSGETVSNPGELLSHHGAALVEQARSLADIVLVDSPPLLATDDASPLLPQIDDVLIICRAGVTTAEAARRTSELLSRLGASAAGVALVGALSSPSVRGYYRTYGATRARSLASNTDGGASQPSRSPAGEDGAPRRAQASDTA